MTDENTCTYVFNPGDPETWPNSERQSSQIDESILNKNGKWRCPHEQTADGSVCIFHQSLTKKSDDKVIDAFEETITNTPSDSHDKWQFIGAEFGRFDPKCAIPDDITTDPTLVFDHAEFYGDVNFPQSIFSVESRFAGVDFYRTVNLPSTVAHPVSFAHSTFHGEILGYGCQFEAKANFHGAEFFKKVDLAESQYEDRTTFEFAIFHDLAHFWQAKFKHRASFMNANIEQGVFAQTIAKEGMKFTLVSFENVEFKDAELDGAIFEKADLSDGKFTNAELHNCDFESAVLNRASLLGTDLRGAKLNAATVGDAQIDDDTLFLGQPAKTVRSSPHTIAAIRERRCCVYDPNYTGSNNFADIDKAKHTYRKIESLASIAGLPQLQSQCFVRRQDLQTTGYKDDAKIAGSWQERIIAGARYTRAKTARVTLLYGESPWRIIGGSIAFIVFLALLYPVGGWLQPAGGSPITYTRIWTGEWELLFESLYFSTLAFTTLGLGDYTPLGFGQVLTTVNTAFGAVLIALLVFVLGRRAAR